MEKLSRSPDLVEIVKSKLFEAVLNGTYRPGDRLKQEEIALKLGVSRQPVSHALRILADQGILEMQGAKSLTVAEIDPDRLNMILEIRKELDCYAAVRAAERSKSGAFSKADLDALNKIESLVERYTPTDLKSVDLKSSVAADIKFHQLLRSLSGNIVIEETLAPFILHYHRLMYLAASKIEPDIWAEHKIIVSAIKCGDVEGARNTMRAHIDNGSGRMAQKMQQTAQNQVTAA